MLCPAHVAEHPTRPGAAMPMAGSCLGLRVPWLCRGWIWDGRSPPDVPGQGCAPGSCCLDLLSQINHRVTVPLGDLCSPSTWNPSSASHLTVMVPGGWTVPLGHGTSSRASLGDCSLHHAQTHSAHSCSQGRSGAAGWNTASPPPPGSAAAPITALCLSFPCSHTPSVKRLPFPTSLVRILCKALCQGFIIIFFPLRKLNISFLFLLLVAKCSDSTGRGPRLQSTASGAGRRMLLGGCLLLGFSFPVQILGRRRRSHPRHTVAWPWWSSCQQREPEGRQQRKPSSRWGTFQQLHWGTAQGWGRTAWWLQPPPAIFPCHLPCSIVSCQSTE